CSSSRQCYVAVTLTVCAEVMVQAVVFDLDNTLVDFMAMKRTAIDAAVTAMIDAGFELTFDQIKSHIDRIYNEQGIEYQRVFDQLLYETLGYVDYKILSAGIIAYRRAREASLKPYPHATATVIELVKRNIKLAVVSDAPTLEAWLRLSYINFHHFFDAVVTFDDTKERKPSPKPFLTALSKLKVEPHNAIMVGDWAERDMVGAKNVGMQTAFARYGDAFGTQNVMADFVLNDITDLLIIIQQQNNTRT
ncbi:MAG: HAD-IA family hydrolase, partial [Bacteroidota bacterium]|nr:HAD-IA family hydrolase [Candidatus Kapabacteria bacterium]MDW8218941.1 HAD-IA family hydrolase [Bacteroidota bacterium]